MFGETTKADTEAQLQSECPRVSSAVSPLSIDLTEEAVVVKPGDVDGQAIVNIHIIVQQ